MLSLCIVELGISLLKDSFVVSLWVSDIWVDNISDSISVLEICELTILSLGWLEFGVSEVTEVVSILVFNISVEEISVINSVLISWEVLILLLNKLELEIPVLSDSFVVSL